jgi:signal transduction histidine kinase
MAVDITERKDNEASLRRKEIELQEANALPESAAGSGKRTPTRVVWSEELSRIAGRDPSLPPVSYKEHSQLYTRESWDRLQSAVEAALHAGTPYELDLEMVRADGTHRWVRARGEAQRDAGGRIAGLRGTVQDITERKRAEEAVSSVNRRLLEAQESERTRIARDLHDDIGQRLALLSVGLGQLKGLQPDSSGEARRWLDALQQQTAEIITDVQTMSHELHPPRLLLLGVVAAMRASAGRSRDRKTSKSCFAQRMFPGMSQTTRRSACSGSSRKRCTTRCDTAGPVGSRWIFTETETLSVSPFGMKALVSTSTRRVEAWDLA